jgi:DMSO/TMAO reductase YedYZ molybdopterin-dependent catalytic subunit
MKRRSFLRLALFFLAGCAVPPGQGLPPTPVFIDTPTSEPTFPPPQPTTCRPEPIVIPTRPGARPGSDMLDTSTGLHVTGNDVVQIDPLSYRLKVSGLVEHPLELTLDELRCMPKVTARVNLTCKGNFEDVTSYTGVPLTHILDLAGVRPTAKSVYLTGAEGYPGFISLEDCLKSDNFLAYQWKDEPLPILHGFPLRAVIPSLLGYAWTKFLVEIKVA